MNFLSKIITRYFIVEDKDILSPLSTIEGGVLEHEMYIILLYFSRSSR